jgi:hypothetical protein
MLMKEFPYNHPWRDRFPQARMVIGFEGGAVYAAEEGDKYYLILDEGTMADFLLEGKDDDLLQILVKVIEFASADERSAYITARGWSPRPANDRRKR